MPSKSLSEKAKLTQAHLDRWNQIAADPHLSRPAALAAHKMVRSYRAALILYQKALAYEEQQKTKAEGRDLVKLFGLSSLLTTAKRETVFSPLPTSPPLTTATSRAAGKYLMTPEQHRRRADQIRRANPDSRAVILHEAAANAIENPALRSLGDTGHARSPGYKHGPENSRGIQPMRLPVQRIVGRAVLAAAIGLFALLYLAVGCAPELRVMGQFFR